MLYYKKNGTLMIKIKLYLKDINMIACFWPWEFMFHFLCIELYLWPLCLIWISKKNEHVYFNLCCVLDLIVCAYIQGNYVCLYMLICFYILYLIILIQFNYFTIYCVKRLVTCYIYRHGLIGKWLNNIY